MSIKDSNDRDIVRLPGFWEVIAKFAFAASVPVLLLGVSWAVWITNLTFTHATELAVVRESLNDVKARIHGVSSQMGKLPGQFAEKINRLGEE